MLAAFASTPVAALAGRHGDVALHSLAPSSLAPHGPAAQSMGLDRAPARRAVAQSVVVQGAGPHGAGLHNASLHGASLHGASLHGAGLHDAGPHASGSHVSGPQAPALHRPVHGPALHDPAPAVLRRPAAPLPLVLLDPGHGGKDPGAIGATGTYEKHVALAAAEELQRHLGRAGGCRAELTRTRDVFIPLQDRVAIAQQRGARLFLSLHADALSDPGVRGASVYTLSDMASDAQTAALAQRENSADRFGGPSFRDMPPAIASILGSLVRRETRAGSERIARHLVGAMQSGGGQSSGVQSSGGQIGRGQSSGGQRDGRQRGGGQTGGGHPGIGLLSHPSRHARFMVLRAADIPSALVEMGFMSNLQDEAALRRPEHRARVAAALARAVQAFLAGPDHGVRLTG